MAAVKYLFVSLMLACTIQMNLAFLPPTAQINNSSIVGQRAAYAFIPVHQYLGIPFAEPPLEELRFQKPKPIESYPEVFTANKNPPACPQYGYSPYHGYVDDFKEGPYFVNEDCLYLNIFAPVSANKFTKKAVLYWIHGGGYRYGGIRDPVNDGSLLASAGDIIVVTVGYRMGVFGFFTSNTPDAPGNVGVWDVLEGLRWVNKYISAFGGDPTKITIGGGDAGAIDVGLLSISPLSKGLYARQIMESGSPAYRRADNNTQNLMFSQKMAKQLGCADDSFTIYNRPQEVTRCVKSIKESNGPGRFYLELTDYFYIAINESYTFVPQFGDEILPENPRLSVINNNFSCTDLLIGTNEDEGAFSLADAEFDDYPLKENQHLNRSSGESIIEKTVSYFPDPEAIVNYYLPPSLQDDVDHRIRHQVFTAYGDTVFACPTVYYAEKCAAQNKNVFYYYFNHKPENSPFAKSAPWINVTHFVEQPFVFGHPIANLTYPNFTEAALSREMVHIWSSFVKYGVPVFPWPFFSKENPYFNYIGPEYKILPYGRGPHAENCEFLRPHFGF